MTIETEVAALTTATTALLGAVNVSKSALDQKVADATAQVGLATAQAAIATTKAGESSASAATASAAATTATAQATNAGTSAATATAQASNASASAATATTQAATATAQAGIATTKASEASASATAAAAASQTYTTEALGRAAVADGQAFKVQGSGDVAAYEYRRVSVGESTLIASYPSNSAVQNARTTPFSKSLTSTNAAGDADLLGRILSGIVDVRLYGLPAGTAYYIERVRRNHTGMWFIAVKRSSDAATVVQFYGALTEPADASAVQKITLNATGVVVGASGHVLVRWSDFVAGATNAGLSMTLSPDCLNLQIASPADALPTTSARMGQVPFTTDATSFVSVDETTRTLAWPELRIVHNRISAYGYLKIAAGAITFDAPFQVAWIDLIEASAYAGGATIPASIVKKGPYGDEGTQPNNYHASSHQYPIAWSSGAGRVDLNPVFRLKPGGGEPVYRDDMVVLVDQASKVISVYVRANGNNLASLTYIHYRLYRHVASNADVWTIDGIWEVSRTGYESFSVGKEIQITAVEMLCALQEVGAADFMGGRAHGDEVITQTPTLIVDGRNVQLGSGAAVWLHASEITFIQSTKLYRDASLAAALSVPLANRKLWLRWSKGEMTADQRIEHLVNYSLKAGYMAMIAPHRYETYVSGASENTGSAQISGYYADNVRMIPMDATAIQASQVADDYVSATSPPVTKVKLWGGYGVECEMEVLYTSVDTLQNLMYVNRTNHAYNKAYIGFISGYSGVQTVTSDTKWQIQTRYRICSKN